jgi:hypothetical protein
VDASIATDAEDTLINGRKPDGAFIAELDALLLSEHELELLRRMEQVCESARAARERRHERFELENDHIKGRSALSEVDSDVELEPRLRLRGGGDDDELPFCGKRRHRTTLPCSRTPKPDSARPHAVKWWLVGGRVSREGKVPTVGELRVRREVELANKKIVGFWGTVWGVRQVGKVGILQEGSAGGEERLEVEDPDEAKTDTVKDAVEDHAEAEAVNTEGAAKDPPEARAESAKSVREGNAMEEAESKAEAARAEHSRDGEAAEIPEESRAKPPSDAKAESAQNASEDTPRAEAEDNAEATRAGNSEEREAAEAAEES